LTQTVRPVLLVITVLQALLILYHAPEEHLVLQQVGFHPVTVANVLLEVHALFQAWCKHIFVWKDITALLAPYSLILMLTLQVSCVIRLALLQNALPIVLPDGCV
jgi:hypothetical protein